VNAAVIGVGKLGLCWALVLEQWAGLKVTGIDSNKKHISRLRKRRLQTIEPHVYDMLLRSSIYFTTKMKEAKKADIIFIVVNTPSLQDGSYDHSRIDIIIEQLKCCVGPRLKPTPLVINCTTMPGYCDTVNVRLENYNYLTYYNPEFIAQGAVIDGLVQPDMVLIGASAKAATNSMLRDIHKEILMNETPIHFMSLIEAEIAKIALNCFITTKISFANMVGDVARKVGASPYKILDAIGTDERVGKSYLRYGYGFGGPCFPRDNRAFGLFCQRSGINPLISQATDKYNEKHLTYQLEEFCRTHSTKDPVFLEDVAYKKGVDILEESQQLRFALTLAYRGYDVTICDIKEVIDQLKVLYPTAFKYQEKPYA